MRNSPKWSARRRADEYERRVTAVGIGAESTAAESAEAGPATHTPESAAFIAESAAYAFRPPRKLYRVSEVADYLGLSRQTIHNYATAGLISEEGHSPGGQRLFDGSVFGDLALIQRLKATHRLQEIRRILAARRRTAAALLLQGAGAQPAEESPSRNLERSGELAALAHREPPVSAPEIPPANSPTSAGSGSVPENRGNDMGPDIAVRAPSAESPSRKGDSGPADPRHVKETPKDDQQRG